VTDVVRTDVVVAGLGVAGASVALALARAGARVVALDAHHPPHSLGSSHGQTRITRRSVAEGDAYVPLVARSHEVWRELEAASGESLYVACGLLVLGDAGGGAHHGQHDFPSATRELAARHGISHEMLTASEVEARYEALVAPEGDAYFEPEGGYLRAEACVTALLEAARRHGAELRGGEAVASWSSGHGRVVVTSSANTYDAERLVLCVGPWLPGLVPSLARVCSVQRQAAHWFEIDDDGYDQLAALPAYLWFHGGGPSEWFYGFPAVDGPAGGIKVATERFGAATAPGAVDRRVPVAESDEVHHSHVAGRLRGVGRRALATSVCLYTVTDDFGFVLDVLPGEPEVLVVSACSGHGFKHAPAVGECAAAMALGAAPPFDGTPFSLARFSGATG
jgi:sarcosine oxidase